jgi:hypothetical protein
MKVIPFEQVPEDLWDEVVDNTSEAWLFHRAKWVRLESAFFAISGHAFALADGEGRFIGVCPLYRRDLGRRSWTERLLDSGHHRHAGPAFRDDLTAEVRKVAMSATMRHILEEAVKLDIDRILLSRHNLSPAALDGQGAVIPFWAIGYGFQIGMALGPYGEESAPGLNTLFADQILDLSQSEEALFRGLGENCRWAVRKALRNGVTMETGGPDAIEVFYQLALLSATRTNEALAPKEYYRQLMEGFAAEGRASIFFAVHQGSPVAGLLLTVDKDAANFQAGFSNPEYLPLQINNLLQWEAILWAKRSGVRRYRLGPVFPELPKDWPVCKVSRFKGTFGARSYPTIQGSLFRYPQKYLDDATALIQLRCTPAAPPDLPLDKKEEGLFGRDLALILRTYGYLAAPAAQGGPGGVRLTLQRHGEGLVVIFAPESSTTDGFANLDCRVESPRQILYRSGRTLFSRRQAAFSALLPQVSFTGPGLTPLWVTADSRPVVAWLDSPDGRSLVCGLNVVEEVIRWRQGDPAKAGQEVNKAKFGFDFERPNYLFEDHVLPRYAIIPWADRLGFFLAETLSLLTGLPLVEPLPHAAKGIILLTGDDDQAYLEKYTEQLDLIRGLPITYFLVPQTRHTAATIVQFPPNVEIGLHPDALDQPENYDQLCEEQARYIRSLSGRAVRTVRNHGFLNRGYWGHLKAWEANGLLLDVNLTGVDGTALNGSYLPFRVRHPDGTWSGHYSLLTAFGDGMVFALNMSQRQARKNIRRVVRQIEQNIAGTVVFNFHPQNIDQTRKLHNEVMRLARRRGWKALGMETYLDWLITMENLQIECCEDNFRLTSTQEVEGIVLRFWKNGWQHKALATFSGTIGLRIS